MKNFFPQSDKQYVQTNRSDVFGNLWSTFNLDFQSNLGVMRVAPRMKLVTSTADDSDFGCPIGFKAFDTKIWTVAGTTVFKSNGLPSDAFVEDASTGSVKTYDADYSDIEFFNNQLWTTNATTLYRKVSNGAGTGAWATVDGSILTIPTVPHVMTQFKRLSRLYVSDGSLVYSVNTSNTSSVTGDYTLAIDAQGSGYVSSMKTTSTFVVIGFTSLTPGITGSVLLWDGLSAQATYIYPLQAQGVASIVIDEDRPFIVDTNGIMYEYINSGFREIELGRLPVDNRLMANIGSGKNNTFIHPNGLWKTKDSTYFALVNNLVGDNAGSINENFASGIYEYARGAGWRHKYSFSYNPVGNSTITDFGQNRISRVGGLAVMNIQSSSATMNGYLMAGSTYFTNASSTSSGAFIDDTNDTVQKKGYFVMPWTESEEIQDRWNRLWPTFRRFLDSSDSIILKYRLSKEAPTYATITWTSTTSFTTTTDVTAYGPTATGFNGTVGGEVEVIQGTGSGTCSHITGVTNNAGTYTVTLDNVVTGVTNGTAKARFQKWIKALPEVTGQIRSWAQVPMTAPADSRIQIKGCLTFTGNGEFYRMPIFSNEDIKINP